ncbi:MAG: hypothetical protein JSW40_08085 [Candidatus Omnitrophota bacterium]|nr:MAG: hypothetical protein JSW40_08085 [Candidatus Omnitrophota bacterium]
MKKTGILLACCVLFLGGCLQSKEHLIIQRDGSGTLEIDTMVPKGTMALIDSMMGGMMQGMTEAFGGKQEAPKSMAEEMFGNKEEVLKKARNAGLEIEFLDFKTEKKEGNLYVKYKIAFDDIQKLIGSGMLSTQITFTKDSEGNLVCSTKDNPQKVQESEMQMAQFQDWKQSEQFKDMDPAMRENILGAMQSLKIEFLITLPNEIKKVSGMFSQKDSTTAQSVFEGNFLEDPSVIQKMFGTSSGPSQVTCSGEGISFLEGMLIKQKTAKAELKEDFTMAPGEDLKTPAPILFGDSLKEPRREEASSVPSLSVPSLGAPVQLFLKNGRIVKGTIVKKSKSSIKVDIGVVAVTYYLDEIDRIE